MRQNHHPGDSQSFRPPCRITLISISSQRDDSSQPGTQCRAGPVEMVPRPDGTLQMGWRWGNAQPEVAATASSTWPQAGYEAAKAVDGETSTRWGAAADARSAWLEVDLGQPQRVGRAVISELQYPRTRQFASECLDGQTWKPLATGTTLEGTKGIGLRKNQYKPLAAPALPSP